jgi:hypothetical protein
MLALFMKMPYYSISLEATTKRSSKMNRIEMIESAKIEDAILYSESDEQFLFCIDWLDMSARSSAANRLVELLEDKFDALLENRKTVSKDRMAQLFNQQRIGTY